MTPVQEIVDECKTLLALVRAILEDRMHDYRSILSTMDEKELKSTLHGSILLIAELKDTDWIEGELAWLDENEKNGVIRKLIDSVEFELLTENL